MKERLGHVPVPVANIHPMPTGPREPGEAAAAYESLLRERFGPDGPVFDLALLGMGAESYFRSSGEAWGGGRTEETATFEGTAP